MKRFLTTTTLIAGALTLSAAPFVQAQDAEATAEETVKVGANPIQTLIETRAKSIVNVRTVMQVSAMGQQQENRMNTTGVVVDASGLILTMNLESDDMLPIPRRTRRMMRQQGMAISMKLQSASVVVDGVEDDLDAFLVATDSELGISFLQISNLGEHKLEALDFSAAGKPALGETVYAVTRMAKAFDFAAVVRESRIGGKVKKPRTSWALTGGITGAGLPLFNAAGQPLGIFTNLSAEAGEGGKVGATLLLPARPVQTAIGRALPKAKELLAERNAAPKKEGEGEEKKDEKPAGDGSGF
ncbi:MAG: trypsin-like peptidase domain-containing protein [Planctomycetota bacterium]|jgi:S1-C subfamily serine protease